MPKMFTRIWRWISHTDTAVSMLDWRHWISLAAISGFAVLTAWLRQIDPIWWVLIGLGFFAFTILIFERISAWRHRKQSPASQGLKEPERVEGKQPLPDWRICEAMDYIAARFGNENEESLDKKYLEPTRLLTSKARSGNIQIWGKRIFGKDSTELSPRLIEQSDWQDIEISIWACSPSSRRPHTQSASQQETQQFTDLSVRESQIKDIQWKADTVTKYNDPIHEAIEYVATRLDDSNSANCYLATRHALRVAAQQSAVILYGKKKVKGGSEPSALRTKISPDFWDDQQLTNYSIADYYRHFIHTEPEHGSQGEKIGESKEQYWEIRVSMDEVKKRWP